MPANPSWLKVDPDAVVPALQQAITALRSGAVDLVVDLGSVSRLDTAAVAALEELAHAAEEKSVPVGLRGANVAVYKVLKLAKLAGRFGISPQ